MQLVSFLFIAFFINHALFSSSSSATASYDNHCSSIVPQSIPTFRTRKDHHIPSVCTSYITGGHRILNCNQTYCYVGKYLSLHVLPDCYETNDTAIYKIDGVLEIGLPYIYHDGPQSSESSHPPKSNTPPSIRFQMNGFWSGSSRKLCMVGSASWEVESGSVIILNAVLKLNFASENISTIHTSVDSGILESTDDPAYFDPISIFSFPVSPNYRYSPVPEETEFDSVANESLSLSSSKFCSAFGTGSPTAVELQYAMQCSSREPQHCSPIGGSLPRSLSLSPIECSMDERKFRFTAKFQHLSNDILDFSIDSIMVGEAWWDDEKKHIYGVVCQLLDPTTHLGNAVGDCSMRFSLWYRSVLTIRNDALIAGQLWSTKLLNHSGYFRNISLVSNYDSGLVRFRERRYEYTEMDRVRESCPLKQPVKKKKGDTYPDANSNNMRLDMSIKSSNGELLSWGYASPISVKNYVIDDFSVLEEIGVSVLEQRTKNSHSNISYKIMLSPLTDAENSDSFPSLNGLMSVLHQKEIMAEGVYDAETGQLCMVGCRKLVVNSTYIPWDCDILWKLEFPRLNGETGGLIKGTIESRRPKQDPLYFEHLVLQSAAYYNTVAEQSVWRMDMEITLVLISSTLACIFVGLQILYVKRNTEAPSSISLIMVLILCAGHMIPLVFNHNQLSFGRLEANEVAVKVITMVALLLQIRLLLLVWTANQKEAWKRERKAGVVSLSLYLIGSILVLFSNWTRKRSVWSDFKSYAGVIVDGFLLPQILLNIFSGSAEKALCKPFYVGTSAVRLVPHAYNQYRAHNYHVFDLNTTYYYANPAADFYSTAWDIIIPFGIVALAVIVFVQQRHGGRCILPQREVPAED